MGPILQVAWIFLLISTYRRLHHALHRPRDDIAQESYENLGFRLPLGH
jgi:hypothetical protein